MFRPSKLVLAAAAATALVAPAVHADEAEWAGFTCGFASSNDPSGLVEQNPNVQTGEIQCGPWTAVDLLADDLSGPSGPSAQNISIFGSIQVNQADFGGLAAAKASVTGSGVGVAAAAGVISYEALATDNVYLCTQVVMSDGSGTYTYTYDEDDNAANGNQCALAISAGA